MYSLLAVRARVPPPQPIFDFSPPDISKMSASQSNRCGYHQTQSYIKSNLTAIVARILASYIKVLRRQKRSQYRDEPTLRNCSDRRCETKRTDMIDIMREMITYLGDTRVKHLSVGNLLTKEQQDSSKRHAMCSNTLTGRLKLLVPV